MAAQYAYVMKDMTKSFPGARSRCSATSTCNSTTAPRSASSGRTAPASSPMKIMAGIDRDYQGEAWPGENITVGYLPQEPQLDPSKTVLENVKDGARARRRHGRPLQRHFGRDGRPEGRHRLRRADGGDGRAPGQDRRGRGWTLDNQLEVAMEALRCPPSDWSVDKLSGGEKRRIALTRLRSRSRRSCCSTSRPTISTPERPVAREPTSRNIRARC